LYDLLDPIEALTESRLDGIAEALSILAPRALDLLIDRLAA
jgi:hypothetical protein